MNERSGCTTAGSAQRDRLHEPGHGGERAGHPQGVPLQCLHRPHVDGGAQLRGAPAGADASAAGGGGLQAHRALRQPVGRLVHPQNGAVAYTTGCFTSVGCRALLRKPVGLLRGTSARQSCSVLPDNTHPMCIVGRA
eukprot:4422588-Pyramimonas_sp.AAC.1